MPFGQQVTLRIDNRVVSGSLEGWDYKGRPKIKTSEGMRIGSWENVKPVGTVREVIPAKAFESLTADQVFTPPARLTGALRKALDQRVTGKHTALEYMDALAAKGHPMYVVGGAIRDAIYLLK